MNQRRAQVRLSPSEALAARLAIIVMGAALWLGFSSTADFRLAAQPLILDAALSATDAVANAATFPQPVTRQAGRPASGTDFVKPVRTGGGSLIVHNDSRRDAVIILAEGTSYSRAMYVRAGDRVTVPNIATGTYRVLIMVGRNWRNDHFTSDVSYQAMEQPVEFLERDIGDITEYTQLTIAFERSGKRAPGVRETAPFRLPAR